METNEQQSSEFSGVIRNAKSFLSLIKCINIKNVSVFVNLCQPLLKLSIDRYVLYIR